MLITENKLRKIIQKIIKEAKIDFKTGLVIPDEEEVVEENALFVEFSDEILDAVDAMGLPVTRVTVINPDDLDVYDDIEYDIHDELRGTDNNYEYNTFGQGMREDEIQNLFEADGPDAVDAFLNWAKNDFEYFEPGQLFETEDSISLSYEGTAGKEYQVAIMFF